MASSTTRRSSSSVRTKIFVMGDNRDNSADSRLSPAAGGVGLVPVENLVGRVDAIIGSCDPTCATIRSGLGLPACASRASSRG